jgi:hypothetical protein
MCGAPYDSIGPITSRGGEMRAALAARGNSAERDLRIVEGVDD